MCIILLHDTQLYNGRRGWEEDSGGKQGRKTGKKASSFSPRKGGACLHDKSGGGVF